MAKGPWNTLEWQGAWREGFLVEAVAPAFRLEETSQPDAEGVWEAPGRDGRAGHRGRGALAQPLAAPAGGAGAEEPVLCVGDSGGDRPRHRFCV